MFVTHEVSSSLDASAIFMMAIFAAIMVRTHQATLQLVDAIVMLQMSYGYLFSVLSLFGCRTKFYGKVYVSIGGTYVRLFLTAATSGYSVWFWFFGVHQMNKGPCEPVMFMFAKVDILGGIRYFWRVMAVLCTAYFGLVFLIGMFSTLAFFGLLLFRPAIAPGGSALDRKAKFWNFATSSSSDNTLPPSYDPMYVPPPSLRYLVS